MLKKICREISNTYYDNSACYREIESHLFQLISLSKYNKKLITAIEMHPVECNYVIKWWTNLKIITKADKYIILKLFLSPLVDQARC